MSDHQDALDVACRDVVELVTDHLEGALDPVTAAAVRRHLSECTGCDDYLAQMEAVIAVTGQVPLESLCERATAELLAAVQSHPPGR